MKKEVALIASDFSPYCQRVEMLLVEKDVPYKKRKIDLSNRPDWFKKSAPLGKVPLLIVDDKVLFESMVICEYLNEAYDLKLHNSDLLVKSWHRGWIEFSNILIPSIFSLINAKSNEAFKVKKLELISKLAILEGKIKYSPYFDGEAFLLIDIAMAPAFKILTSIENKYCLEIFDRLPKVAAYAENLVIRCSLGQIIPKEYNETLDNLLAEKDSYILKIK